MADAPMDTYSPAVVIELPPGVGARAVLPMEGPGGGMADAIYHYAERRESSGKWLYRLDRIEEWMPPRPPQLQGHGDDVRLPMMEDGAFSARLEAEQRRREWAAIRG